MDAIYTTGNEKFKDVEEEINEQIKKYNELIIYLKQNLLNPYNQDISQHLF